MLVRWWWPSADWPQVLDDGGYQAICRRNGRLFREWSQWETRVAREMLLLLLLLFDGGGSSRPIESRGRDVNASDLRANESMRRREL